MKSLIVIVGLLTLSKNVLSQTAMEQKVSTLKEVQTANRLFAPLCQKQKYAAEIKDLELQTTFKLRALDPKDTWGFSIQKNTAKSERFPNNSEFAASMIGTGVFMGGGVMMAKIGQSALTTGTMTVGSIAGATTTTGLGASVAGAAYVGSGMTAAAIGGFVIGTGFRKKFWDGPDREKIFNRHTNLVKQISTSNSVKKMLSPRLLSLEEIKKEKESFFADTRKMRKYSDSMRLAELKAGSDLGKLASFIYEARYGRRSTYEVEANDFLRKVTHFLDLEFAILAQNRLVQSCIAEMKDEHSLGDKQVSAHTFKQRYDKKDSSLGNRLRYDQEQSDSVITQ